MRVCACWGLKSSWIVQYFICCKLKSPCQICNSLISKIIISLNFWLTSCVNGDNITPVLHQKWTVGWKLTYEESQAVREGCYKKRLQTVYCTNCHWQNVSVLQFVTELQLGKYKVTTWNHITRWVIDYRKAEGWRHGSQLTILNLSLPIFCFSSCFSS